MDLSSHMDTESESTLSQELLGVREILIETGTLLDQISCNASAKCFKIVSRADRVFMFAGPGYRFRAWLFGAIPDDAVGFAVYDWLCHCPGRPACSTVTATVRVSVPPP
jgi:hypothetical protein